MVELTLEIGIAYGALLTMALIPIYIGSHSSLKQKMESMSSKDAYMAPFVGSLVLFGLYILFRVFHKDYINLLLSSYFVLFGIMALAATIRPIFERLLPGLVRKNNPYVFSAPKLINKFLSEPWEVKFDGVDVVCVIIGAVIGVWYALTKNWIANNFLGLSFSIQAISLISLGSYKVGCILLGGLFFYDIFWVFGTEVMVTVAKSFDAPIKLLFPKNIFASEFQFSMLGLGDIVIPGLLIALLLRFDKKSQKSKKGSFKKTLFHACFVGYILGLATTIFVMHTFQAAQPALLYLVPYCIGSSALVAMAKGQFSSLLSYSEETPANKKDDKATVTATATTEKKESEGKKKK